MSVQVQEDMKESSIQYMCTKMRLFVHRKLPTSSLSDLLTLEFLNATLARQLSQVAFTFVHVYVLTTLYCNIVIKILPANW